MLFSGVVLVFRRETCIRAGLSIQTLGSDGHCRIMATATKPHKVLLFVNYRLKTVELTKHSAAKSRRNCLKRSEATFFGTRIPASKIVCHGGPFSIRLKNA